jgi:hypothetical protein
MEGLEPHQAGPAYAAGPERQVGPEARRRFDFQSWGHRRGPAGVAPPNGRIGSLAAQTNQFVAVIGRSLASRRMIGQRSLTVAGRTGDLPVRLPDEYFPVAGERRRFAVSATEAERRSRRFWEIQQRMTGVRKRDYRPPPIGLPMATARAGQSRVGRQTGPAGASKRMAGQPAFVSSPREVSWSGPLVSGRDRLAVGAESAGAKPPPVPPTGELKAVPALRAQRSGAPYLPGGGRRWPGGGASRDVSGTGENLGAAGTSVAGRAIRVTVAPAWLPGRSLGRPPEPLVARRASRTLPKSGAGPARSTFTRAFGTGIRSVGAGRTGSEAVGFERTALSRARGPRPFFAAVGHEATARRGPAQAGRGDNLAGGRLKFSPIVARLAVRGRRAAVPGPDERFGAGESGTGTLGRLSRPSRPIAGGLGGLGPNVQLAGAGERLDRAEVAASSAGRANTAGGMRRASATAPSLFSTGAGRVVVELLRGPSSGGSFRPVPGGATAARRRLAGSGREPSGTATSPVRPARFGPVARGPVAPDPVARGPVALGPGSHPPSYESPGEGATARPVLRQRSRSTWSWQRSLSLQRSLDREQRRQAAIGRALPAAAPGAPLWPYSFKPARQGARIAPVEGAVVRQATNRQAMSAKGVRPDWQPALSGARAQSSARRVSKAPGSASGAPSQSAGAGAGAPGWGTLSILPVVRPVRPAVGPLVTRLASGHGRLAGTVTGSPMSGGQVIGMRAGPGFGVGADVALTAVKVAGAPLFSVRRQRRVDSGAVAEHSGAVAEHSGAVAAHRSFRWPSTYTASGRVAQPNELGAATIRRAARSAPARLVEAEDVHALAARSSAVRPLLSSSKGRQAPVRLRSLGDKDARSPRRVDLARTRSRYSPLIAPTSSGAGVRGSRAVGVFGHANLAVALLQPWQSVAATSGRRRELGRTAGPGGLTWMAGPDASSVDGYAARRPQESPRAKLSTAAEPTMRSPGQPLRSPRAGATTPLPGWAALGAYLAAGPAGPHFVRPQRSPHERALPEPPMLLRATREGRLQTAKAGQSYGGLTLPARGSAGFALLHRERHSDQHDSDHHDSYQHAPVRQPLAIGRSRFSAAAARVSKATPVNQGAAARRRSRAPQESSRAMMPGPLTSYLGAAAVWSVERLARGEPAASEGAFFHRDHRWQRGSARPAPGRAAISAPPPAGPVGRQGQVRIELEPNERAHRAATSSPGRPRLSQERRPGTSLATVAPGDALGRPPGLALPGTGGVGLAPPLTAATAVRRRHITAPSAGFKSPGSASARLTSAGFTSAPLTSAGLAPAGLMRAHPPHGHRTGAARTGIGLMTSGLTEAPLPGAGLAPAGLMGSAVAGVRRTTEPKPRLSSLAGALAANVIGTRRTSAGTRSPGHLGVRAGVAGWAGSGSGAVAPPASVLSIGGVGPLSAGSPMRAPIISGAAPQRIGPTTRHPGPATMIPGPTGSSSGLLQSSEASVSHSWPRAQRTAIGGPGRPRREPHHSLGLTLSPMVLAGALARSAPERFRRPAGAWSATVVKRSMEGARPPRNTLTNPRPIGTGLIGTGLGGELAGRRLTGGPAIHARGASYSVAPPDLVSAGPTGPHRPAWDLTSLSSPSSAHIANMMRAAHPIEGSTGARLIATGSLLAARRGARSVNTGFTNARPASTGPASTGSARPGLTSNGLLRPGSRGNRVPPANRSGTGSAGTAQRATRATSASNRRAADIVTAAPRRPIRNVPAWRLLPAGGRSGTVQTGDSRGHLRGGSKELALQPTAGRVGHNITGTTKLRRAVSAPARGPATLSTGTNGRKGSGTDYLPVLPATNALPAPKHGAAGTRRRNERRAADGSGVATSLPPAAAGSLVQTTQGATLVARAFSASLPNLARSTAVSTPTTTQFSTKGSNDSLGRAAGMTDTMGLVPTTDERTGTGGMIVPFGTSRPGETSRRSDPTEAVRRLAQETSERPSPAEQFDMLAEALAARRLDELERRGLFLRPDVF